MKRRAYLAAIAVSGGSAGCIGNQYPSAGGGSSEGGVGSDGSDGGVPDESQIDTTEKPDPLPPPVTNERLRPGDGPLADTNAIEIAVHEQLNGVRQEFDLSLLSFADGPRESAQNHSRDMAHKGYFAHEAPNGQRFIPNGCNPSAENLFRYKGLDVSPRDIAEEAVRAWMGSEGHRRNILNPDLGRHGVGAAKSTDRWVYVTDVFCG